MADIQGLVKKYVGGRSLTAAEVDDVLRYLAAKQETDAAEALKEGRPAPVDIQPFDIVRAVIPGTVEPGGSYEIQGVPYRGQVEVPYCIYAQLCRMHQADVLAYRELFEKRGSRMFGLSEHIQWIPPTIPFHFVKKDTAKAAQERADRAAAYQAQIASMRRVG